MKNKIYSYFFHEFIRYFTVSLFALVVVIWTIQSVNLLDLVTDDGHAFTVYFTYSILSLPKILTKLIPFSFLIAVILTILKLERDNELIILWTSGLNKIHIVNLIFRISILITFIQLLMAVFINPSTLNYSRAILKDSQLQFIPSLLKERQFNDTVEGLTIFVDKKNLDGTYNNIFIRDDSSILTKVSNVSSTIFAKSGFISKENKNLVLRNGNIQRLSQKGDVNIIKFEKTELNLSGISTKTISEPKIQETPTIQIIQCMRKINAFSHNCTRDRKNDMDTKIEINRRIGIPLFIPIIGMLSCFLLSTRRESKSSAYNKYIYFLLGFSFLVIAEITVRYSGFSIRHTFFYYLFPAIMFPLIYFNLIRKFKYENLK